MLMSTWSVSLWRIRKKKKKGKRKNMVIQTGIYIHQFYKSRLMISNSTFFINFGVRRMRQRKSWNRQGQKIIAWILVWPVLTHCFCCLFSGLRIMWVISYKLYIRTLSDDGLANNKVLRRAQVDLYYRSFKVMATTIKDWNKVCNE